MVNRREVMPMIIIIIIIIIIITFFFIQREILFTTISKNIYKNYKILKKIEKYI